MKTRISNFSTAAALGLVLASASVATAQLAPRSGSVPPNQDAKFQEAASKKIDKMIGSEFRKKKMRPLGKATDEQFVRRAYLNAIGRIPTFDEANGFLTSEDPDKRSKLISTLLDSEGYNMHTFNWWADLLRATDEFQNTSGAPYIKWIKDSIAENKPFNTMVHQLISAKGGGWQNGAVGYYVRDSGMLKDNMANTTRIFLGTRIECAQCHNHPFDSWKQTEFYEMAAFTDGVTSSKRHLSRFLNDKEDELRRTDRELSRLARLVRYSVYDFSVTDKGTGKIKLPHDFKERGGEPGDMVTAKTLTGFGKGVRASKKGDKPGEARQEFAGWVTSSDNPRFKKVIANRMWKRVMGVGLFEPLDNFSAASSPSNPALMAYLEELIVDLNYDLKAFQKILYNTYAFQLAPAATQHPERSPYHFNGRQLKRLAAEQVWDSLLTLKVGNPDKRKGNGYAPAMVGNKPMKDLYNEVMAIDDEGALWEYIKDLKKTTKGGGGNMMGSMSYNAGKKYGNDMRASELPSPMPNGHFLRQFGQSDREVIENASTDSDVTQVLSILNGHVEKNLTSNSGSEVYKVVNAGKTDEEKVERMFLAILTRRPTDAEAELFLNEFKMDPGNAVENGVAALLTSAEFMFAQ